MDVADVLALETEGLGALRSPVMVVALSGWFDVGSAATTAVSRLAPPGSTVTIGEIDPDPFYDFTQERPYVEISDGELRTIRWPENRFDVCRGQGGRDLVILVGAEPHMYWRTYAECVTTVGERVGCEAVVTVGAAAEALPHTRTPLVTGSTTNAELAAKLGLAPPSYQGVTGLAGVLQTELERRRIPAISLRVGIPHYLVSAEHPQAVAALQAHLGHVLGLPIHDDLREEIARWRSLHDDVVESDPQLGMYLRMLEQEYDRRTEEAIPDADDLGARFEQFLRDQRDD